MVFSFLSWPLRFRVGYRFFSEQPCLTLPGTCWCPKYSPRDSSYRLIQSNAIWSHVATRCLQHVKCFCCPNVSALHQSFCSLLRLTLFRSPDWLDKKPMASKQSAGCAIQTHHRLSGAQYPQSCAGRQPRSSFSAASSVLVFCVAPYFCFKVNHGSSVLGRLTYIEPFFIILLCCLMLLDVAWYFEPPTKARSPERKCGSVQ